MYQSTTAVPNLDKHQSSFNKLNGKQQEAVLKTEGQVLVLAGPGSGKTEILAIRIGQILKQQDVYPSNILCLTYSNAAVDAMRNRLRELIGATADEIGIYTYHSLCNKLIQQNANDTFKGRTLITDAQRFMLIEKIIYGHLSPSDKSFLKPASGARINDLTRIFSTLKQEGITKDELIRHAEKCINNILPFEEKYLRLNGELNAAGEKLKNRINSFANEIANMYEDYNGQLEAKNKYEFEDMLIEGVLLLKGNKNFVTHLHEQYQYILVDEFQDTNLKQLALIDELCSKEMEPNIFAVGDDDQCIYRFQGANSFNFEWMRNKFPKLETIVLDINYRSTDVILKESFRLISNNGDRQPEKDKPLIAGNPAYNNISHKPVVKVYENAEQEAFDIARQIHESYDGQYNGVAILARKHREFDIIIKCLDHFKIPHKTNRNWVDLLSTPFGINFYNLLQFIRCHDGNKRLAEGFLVQFLMGKHTGNDVLRAFLLYKKSSKTSFYDWLNSDENKNTVLLETAKKLNEIHLNQNNLDLIGHVNECIVLAEQGLNYTSIEQEKNALNEFVSSFLLTDKDKTMWSLANMLWYHKENGISIKVELEVNEDVNQNCVLLSTIHGSKGLQYDAVFLIVCQNTNWEERNHGEGIKVPDLLNRFIVPEPDSKDDMRRLIYVAFTRAKTKLHISCYRKSYSGKDLYMTSLLEGLKLSDQVQFEEVSEFELPSMGTDTYQVACDDELMSLIRERLMTYEISPSSTGSFERCQNEYFFNALMKMPGKSAEAASFGTLVHEVLQLVASEPHRQSDQRFIDKLVEQEMEKLKLNFHTTRIGRYMQYGKWLIKDYLSNYPMLQKPDCIENEFHAILSNGAKLKGKLDRVEINGNLVKVVDYKTGKWKESLKKFESAEEPGTQYWRQANMYTFLMNENFKEASDFIFEFHYPEKEKTIEPYTYEQNQFFHDWLGELWTKTQSLTFDSQCANPACVYCRNKLNN